MASQHKMDNPSMPKRRLSVDEGDNSWNDACPKEDDPTAMTIKSTSLSTIDSKGSIKRNSDIIDGFLANEEWADCASSGSSKSRSSGSSKSKKSDIQVTMMNSDEKNIPSSNGETNPPNMDQSLRNPLSDLGVSTFHFAFYPEGEEMIKFNRESTKAHATHFTSKKVWETGSSVAFLEEYVTRMHPDDVEHMQEVIGAHFQAAMSGDIVQICSIKSNRQFRALMPDGSYHWHELRSQLMVNPGSDLVICEGVFLDINDQKTAEFKLEKKSNDLEDEIDDHIDTQRALERALADLQKAQAKLLEQERLQALGEMVSTVSHDFGNLLTPMKNSTKFIMDDLQLLYNMFEEKNYVHCKTILTDIAESTEDIHTAAVDGQELIKKFHLDHRPMDMVAPVEEHVSIPELLDNVKRIAKMRWEGLSRWKTGGSSSTKNRCQLDIVVNTGGGNDATHIKISESLLRQGILNFVYKAIDSMVEKIDHDPSSLSLILSSYATEAALMIEIEDQGMGMSPERLQNFEEIRSSSGDINNMSVDDMNMARSFETIEGLGGVVEVTSTIGIGSSVTINLPMD